MPIKFACEHCQKRLVVGTRMSGATAPCPSCGKPTRIPEASPEALLEAANAAPAANGSGVTAPSATPSATASAITAKDHLTTGPAAALPGSLPSLGGRQLFEEFIVYDDDYVEDVSYDETTPEPVAPQAAYVSIPRTVIYVQGALLAVVAIVAFVLGIMAGGTFRGSDGIATAPMPFTLRGKIEYRSATGRIRPDEGAVVVLLPQNARPEAGAKWSPVGLRPEDAMPEEDDAALRAIQELGGDYARADLDGNYELHGADRGEYFVLVISRRGHRSDNDPPRRSDVAQIGRYFSPTLDLLSQKQYRWLAMNVTGDSTRDVAFE